VRTSPSTRAALALALALLPLACASLTPGDDDDATPFADCPDRYVLGDDGLCWLLEVDPGRIDPLDPVVVPGCETLPEPPLFGAGCSAMLEDDVHFETEAQMATFCEDYDCISGGVMIGLDEVKGGEGFNTDITTLEPLACLRASRFLMIGRNANLPHAELPNYRHTGGGFTVSGNEGLESVSMPALEYVGGDLSIQINPDLASISLPSLELVGEFFLIVRNGGLSDDDAWAVRDALCPDAVGATTAVGHNGDD